MPPGLAIAPTMQAIVVDCVTFVEPQLAPIVRNNPEIVMARPEDSQATCPTDSKVITSFETPPFLICVAIVHHLAPTSHVWFACVQVLAPPTLTKVEDILPEDAMPIRDPRATTSAACTHNNPSVACIRPMVPKEHASMTASLKHL
jgi:hypothetical protein